IDENTHRHQVNGEREHDDKNGLLAEKGKITSLECKSREMKVVQKKLVDDLQQINCHDTRGT
ncbi:Hypothetical protein FKW44_016160, partial [Caligus rogercresseyi]